MSHQFVLPASPPKTMNLLALGMVVTVLWLFIRTVYHYLFKPNTIANIPGPVSNSFIYGNLRELLQGQVGDAQFKWKAEFGGVARFKGILGEDCLLISDPRAIQFISSHTDEFQKHPILREISRMLFGRGLVWADGDDHKRQRRINSPAFGANQIRAFIPYFYDCVGTVIQTWTNTIEASKDDFAVIDVTRMISLGTLDAIGKAAFAYEFNAVADFGKRGGNELANCFRNFAHDTFGVPKDSAIFAQEITGWLPIKLAGLFYDYMPLPALRRVHHTTKVGHRVAREMIAEKGDELLAGKEKRDILSLLVKANASSEAKANLSHEEMMATLHTLVIAGHETTATWLNWIMLELARNPEVQAKLRQEIYDREDIIRARGDSMLSANDLEQEMPYLQAILKETLRFHSPIYHHLKVPTVDSLVPLSASINATDGKVLKSLNISKGTHLYLDIAGFNRDTDIFGSDADIWRPERFLNGEVNETSGIAGPYAGVMTFSAGPRTCIGWRFAVLEAAVFTAEFVRNFTFELTPAATKIKREASLAMIPVLEGEEDKGHQLPLKVSIASRD